ncbi:MAG TPA: chemotaxis protein CheW [Gemmatimonadales bacterium]|nr:chemotaxis protein CheW [Gemmatimonadales bacterium]
MTSANDGTQVSQYLTFEVADAEYAVGILRVREIIEYDTLTRVPSAPPAVRGVINLRGSVVPVVDLAVKFGLEARSVTKRTCIVIVECELDGQAAVMGVLVDAVRQVVDLGAADIEAAPAFGSGVRVEFLLGMGKTDRGFVLLLDMDRLLAAQEAAVGLPAA